MGKGDQRTKKGKINRGTSGKSRPKKPHKSKASSQPRKPAASAPPRRAG